MPFDFKMFSEKKKCIMNGDFYVCKFQAIFKVDYNINLCQQFFIVNGTLCIFQCLGLVFTEK